MTGTPEMVEHIMMHLELGSRFASEPPAKVSGAMAGQTNDGTLFALVPGEHSLLE